jgi:hypothetical protein
MRLVPDVARGCLARTVERKPFPTSNETFAYEADEGSATSRHKSHQGEAARTLNSLLMTGASRNPIPSSVLADRNDRHGNIRPFYHSHNVVFDLLNYSLIIVVLIKA